MLQTNLIFGIQKKIKEGKWPKDKTGAGIIEEGTVVEETATPAPKKKEILLENFYSPGIASGIYEQVKNNRKADVHKKSLMTEAFHLRKAEKKLTTDINYFNYLYENFVPDAFKEDYQMLLENIFEDTIRLYQECDVTPRVISPALDSNELSESQIVDLYRNVLNKTVKDNYTKPLLSGKISELYENEIRVLTKKLLQENVVTDTEQVRVYLPFEETIYRFNREVMIPKTAQSRMESFMESTTSEYTDLLEESAQDILKAVEQKIKLLTSMIAPDMFNKAVDAEGVDAPKMAGISIAVDKNFDDVGIDDCAEADGPCTADAQEDPEAAEELADEDEASSIDSAGEDIVGAEEDARDQTDLVNDVDDLEGQAAEDRAELSPAEAAGEDDQPGAVESDLPLETSSHNDTGYADNSSDVGLQGGGNDNGVDAGASGATLPGGATNGTSSDVSDDSDSGSGEVVNNDDEALSTGGDSTNTGDQDLSDSPDSLPAAGAELPSAADESIPNDSDQSTSSGSATAAPVSVTDEEVGEDNDDSNEGLGAEVDVNDPGDEVNTETPSEDEMDEVEKDKEEVNASVTPRL